MVQKMKQITNTKKYGEIYYKVNHDDYYEFLDNNETTEWGNEIYDNWAKWYKKIMSQANLNNYHSDLLFSFKSIECYCGYLYRGINQYLRCGNDNENHHYRELTNILLILFSSAPRIPKNIILYRLVCDEFIDELIKNNKLELPIPTLEKGFLSTSLLKENIISDIDFNHHNNLLKIYVPKGTQGIYVNTIALRNEQEMLLSANYYLGLLRYPYKDTTSNKIIYECKLIYS